METVLNAFRRAHRTAKVTGIEEAFGTLTGLPSLALAAQVTGWETQLLVRALLVLRQRGVPEPQAGGNDLFAKMVLALKTCKEATDDDPDHQAGRKPAA